MDPSRDLDARRTARLHPLDPRLRSLQFTSAQANTNCNQQPTRQLQPQEFVPQWNRSHFPSDPTYTNSELKSTPFTHQSSSSNDIIKTCSNFFNTIIGLVSSHQATSYNSTSSHHYNNYDSQANSNLFNYDDFPPLTSQNPNPYTNRNLTVPPSTSSSPSSQQAPTSLPHIYPLQTNSSSNVPRNSNNAANDFQTVHARKKRRASEGLPIAKAQKQFREENSLPFQNKFQVLDAIPEDEVFDEAQSSITTPTASTSLNQSANLPPLKIPPILLHKVENHKNAIEIISEILEHSNFLAKLAGPYVKVLTNKIEDFRILRNQINSKGLQFHTYNDPGVKLLNVIIRDDPSSYTCEEIREELEKSISDIHSVTRLYDNDKNPWPLVAVSITDNSQGNKIFDIQSLFSAQIRIETRRRSLAPIQCKFCRRFGHLKKKCGLQAVCPKCSENHLAKGCKATSLTCANCQGEHMATRNECPICNQHLNNLHFHNQPPINPSRPPQSVSTTPPITNRQFHFATPTNPSQPQSYPSNLGNNSQNPTPSFANLFNSTTAAPTYPNPSNSSSNHIIEAILKFLYPYLPAICNFILNLLRSLFNPN